MYIIVHKGTKRDRLRNRKSALSNILMKDIKHGDSDAPKGSVYDFAAWEGEKKKGLGKYSNKSLVNEAFDIHQDFKKKGDEI